MRKTNAGIIARFTIHPTAGDLFPTMRVITLTPTASVPPPARVFFAWLAEQNADVVCIQETKAQEHQLSPEVYRPVGYHCHYHDAERKGYSGVALYRVASRTRCEPGWLAGMRPRGPLAGSSLRSAQRGVLYLPSGSAKPERQQVKFDFMARLAEPLRAMHASGRDFILCGDWNIAHKEIDLKTGVPIATIPAFCPRNEPGWMSCSDRWAGWTLSGR